MLNAAASTVICVWATWCVFSSKINDGIAGRLLLSCTALAAFSCATAPHCLHPQTEATLKVCLAALAFRHWFVCSVFPVVSERLYWVRHRLLG